MAGDNKNKKIAEEIKDTALELGGEGLQEELKSEEALINEIKTLYKQIMESRDEIERHKGIFYSKYGKMFNLDKETEEYIEFRKNILNPQKEDWYNKIMGDFLKFQNLANELLGQKVQMIFIDVDTEGNTKIYEIDNTLEHLTFDPYTENGKGRYSTKGKILKDATMVVKKKSQQQNALDVTFKEVYRRFNIAKKHKNDFLKKQKEKKGIEDNKGYGYSYILWKTSENTWDGAYLNNIGSLGEAYYAFFINNFLIRGNIEKRVETFMMHKKYGAVKADSESGFLKGDIVKGNIQYGVKMLNATALGFENVLKKLENTNLLNKNGDNFKKVFKNLKTNLKKDKSDNMVKYLEGKLDSIEETVLKKIKENIENGTKLSEIKISNIS